MADTVLDRLRQLLTARGVHFSVSEHAAVYTSEQAAAVRGTSLASGAKALVCKADDSLAMFVLPADRRLASKLVRAQCRIKSLRFASAEEVLAATGLTPGSIPPFGSLFGLPTWCDDRLAEHESINFNAGDHAVSISLRYADYIAVEQPRITRLSD